MQTCHFFTCALNLLRFSRNGHAAARSKKADSTNTGYADRAESDCNKRCLCTSDTYMLMVFLADKLVLLEQEQHLHAGGSLPHVFLVAENGFVQ